MILQVTKSLGRAILQVVFALLLVMLVALALYVTLGRQLTPMVGNYQQALEQRLSQMLDASVTFGSIEGEWEGFGPRFLIQDLTINPRNGDESATLVLDQISVAPDIPASVRQLRPVLGHTTLHQLDLALHEQSNGRWSLAGLTTTGAGAVSPAQILDWIKSLALLELEQTILIFRFRVCRGATWSA